MTPAILERSIGASSVCSTSEDYWVVSPSPGLGTGFQSEGAGAYEPPLGTEEITVVPTPGDGGDMPIPENRKRRRKEQLLRHHRRHFAMTSSQRGCGAEVIPHHRPTVKVTTVDAPGGPGRLYVQGLKTCGSVWCCSSCSSRICRARGERLQAAIDVHLAEGGYACMVTATLPHHKGHTLENVVEAVTRSWTYLLAGNPWQKWVDRMGHVGTVKGLEATAGGAGWHPHIHALMFLRSDPGPELEADFLAWLSERWARKIESWYLDEAGALRSWSLCKYVGGVRNRLPEPYRPLFGRPSPEHGIRITKADKAGEYLAKMGLGRELSGLDVKAGRGGNRTPWQILGDHVDHGEIRDAVLWVEWCRVMSGRRQLVWTPGLRARLVPAQLDMTDRELAEPRPPPESVLVLQFEPMAWWPLQRASLAGAGRDWSVLLCELLNEGGPDLMVETGQEMLQAIGVPGSLEYDPGRRYVWLT